MKRTREKILDKSRELFNEQGIQVTTLRQIAIALGISQGNLNYHFKTKQQILEDLYFELVKRMDDEMQAMAQQASVLSMLYESAGKSMLVFYEYRFLLRDMYSVFRENEKIKTHYLGLQQVRKQQFLSVFGMMTAQGLLRGEEFPNEYERLYERMNILGDNWINAAGLLRVHNTDAVTYYHRLLFEVIYPYLTAEGKAEFLRLI